METTVLEIAASFGSAPKRSLILAGGGMRVAYQAGVIRALVEHGYRFAHIDGSSGGIINLSMILSGIDSSDMIRRWTSLDVQSFSSPMPLRAWLSPMNLPGLSSADGIRTKVFPHLGIDEATLNRERSLTGTFNVANFSRKTVEVISNDVVTLDLLIAGVSLPIVMPAVTIDGDAYIDAVWIRDANLLEAVRRGAEEIWVVWCIGNTKHYKPGPFAQYVHMIEMSANGSLFDQLERIEELNKTRDKPVIVHVIRPEYPIPLDPDFFLGRITAQTLIEIGYDDAQRYLSDVPSVGTPLTPAATAMVDETPGVTFTERMSGWFAFGEFDAARGAARGQRENTRLTLHGVVDIRDLAKFLNDPSHPGVLNGHVDGAGLRGPLLGTRGVFKLFSPTTDPALKLMVYEVGFTSDGKQYYLAGKKLVRHHFVLKLWPDTTTLYVQLHEGTDASGPVVGAGILHLGIVDLIKLLVTMHATNADANHSSRALVLEFLRMFLGELWVTYMQRLMKSSTAS